MKTINYISFNTAIKKGVAFFAVVILLVSVASPIVVNATYDHEETGLNTDVSETVSTNSHENEKDKDENDGHDSNSETKNDKDHKDKGNSHSNKENNNFDSYNNDHKNDDHKKITICHATHSETNPYVKITVSESAFNAHNDHQNDEDVFADINGRCPGDDRGGNHPANEVPVITLIGNSVETILVGTTYVDVGAEANDFEDGDITSNIIKENSVDSSVIGSYQIKYNVRDSKGLNAVEVVRTVNVINTPVKGKGKISFCLVLADKENNIATSSQVLPSGKFTINLATTTSNIASTTIRTKTWTTNDFSPNAKTILAELDSDCITYDNLDYDTYLYSNLSIEGLEWNNAKFNDQNDHGVNNIADFYPYGNTNTNSDGVVIIGGERPERTVYIYGTYNKESQCLLPIITSPLSVSTVINTAFTYSLSATSTGGVTFSVSSSTLPSGLSYSTTTNTISGIPTTSGTYDVKLTATNSCGIAERMLLLNISLPNTGGNNTGANLSITKVANVTAVNASSSMSYTITLINSGPEEAKSVTVQDVLPAQVEFVSASSTIGSYGTSTSLWTVGNLASGSTTSMTLIVNVKSGTEGQKIINVATASSTTTDPDNSNNTSTSEVSINPIQTTGNGGGGGGGSVVNISTGGGGGGNGPIVGSFGGSIASTGGGFGTTTQVSISGGSCSYLNDYLRRDFNNSRIEVTKLQAFLRIFEGEKDLDISGVYDDVTVGAVNRFQMKYKEDILTPWGHTAPTGYTYILTKKKVNEIFCNKMITLSAEDQSEIVSYRNKTKSVAVNAGNYVGGSNEEVGYGSSENNNVVKKVVASSSSSNGTSQPARGEDRSIMGTLAAVNTTTRNIANNFTVSTTESTKKLSNFLFSMFGLPKSWFGGASSNMCELNYSAARFLNLILLAIIAILLYLWNRQSKPDKSTYEELNKEIDLK